MSDSLLEDNLTTADIAHPTPRQARAEAMDRNAERVEHVDPPQQPIELPAATPNPPTASAQKTGPITDAGALFPEDELHNFRARWDQVQTSFVDEPRQSVEQADSLVANVVKRIAEQFSVEREKLESQWGKGEDISTEDLRQALRRYRSFFDRLLSF
jgi:hypothetical protein